MSVAALPVEVRVAEYVVCAVPRTYPEWHHWALKVAERAPDRWAVVHWSRCLGKRGNWSYESIPSSRTDRWKNAYRHDLETALRLARHAALTLTVNGLTPEGYMRGYEERQAVSS